MTEMRELSDVYEKHEYFWITYRGAESSSLKDAYYYTDYKSVFVKMVIQLMTVWRILLIEKPDLMISTGAAIAIPAAIYSKVCRVKIIYMDCGTSIYEPSGTSRYMIQLADVFLTQWPNMVKVYKGKAKYWGGVL